MRREVGFDRRRAAALHSAPKVRIVQCATDGIRDRGRAPVGDQAHGVRLDPGGELHAGCHDDRHARRDRVQHGDAEVLVPGREHTDAGAGET